MAELMTDEQLKPLADLIKEGIRENFSKIHLSGNLMNNIIITRTDLGFEIDVPASMYDIATYRKSKVIVYNGKGSYAQEVNATGGFSGMHIGYIEKAILDAIKKWINENNLNGKVSEIQ